MPQSVRRDGEADLLVLKGGTARQRDAPAYECGQERNACAIDQRDVGQVEGKATPLGGEQACADLVQFGRPGAGNLAFQVQAGGLSRGAVDGNSQHGREGLSFAWWLEDAWLHAACHGRLVPCGRAVFLGKFRVMTGFAPVR